MLDLIGAVLSGGATGILGIVAQRLFDHWKLKQETDKLKAQHAHAEAMRRIDVELMREEWAQRVKIADREATAAENKAEAEAFAKSFGLEPARYSEGVKPGKLGGFLLVLVDCVRAIVRPGLTLYLAIIATQLYLDSAEILEAVAPEVQATELLQLHRQIVVTLLYLFTTCVLWWFGTRNKAPAPGAKAA